MSTTSRTAALLAALSAWIAGAATAARYEAELVFPLHPKHNHAPGIVECPNGDLLVSWYRGSGERKADDVAVYGARRRKDSANWSEPFLMVDTPGFPDCNTAMHVDADGRLWLFWPVIIANTWESCITNYRVSSQFMGDGPPKWDWQGIILLKPRDAEPILRKALDDRLKGPADLIPYDARDGKMIDLLRQRIGDRLYQRLGWQPRCKPTVLPSGRIVLPLYSDTYAAGIMAISDDKGRTWYASQPLAGCGSIQPTVLRRKDGTLVAYMRENGPLKRIRVAESGDDGVTWGPVGVIGLPNPGAGIDGVRLANGHWVLVYNDTTEGRNSLAVSLSLDEGRTWKPTRHLEHHATGSYHYPAVIQAHDSRIHVVYSVFVEGGTSIRHAVFDEAWITGGD
ncbi:MAG: sialidase family protein [Phycisphaerae bacterium]